MNNSTFMYPSSTKSLSVHSYFSPVFFASVVCLCFTHKQLVIGTVSRNVNMSLFCYCVIVNLSVTHTRTHTHIPILRPSWILSVCC